MRTLVLKLRQSIRNDWEDLLEAGTLLLLVATCMLAVAPIV